MYALESRVKKLESNFSLIPKRTEVYTIWQENGIKYLREFSVYGGNQPSIYKRYEPMIEYVEPEDNDQLFRIFATIVMPEGPKDKM
jgi:hypothetical protein